MDCGAIWRTRPTRFSTRNIATSSCRSEQMGDIVRKLTEFGLISGALPARTHGGMGLDWPTMIMLFEEVAATSIDLSVPVLINSFGAQMLREAGTCAFARALPAGPANGRVVLQRGHLGAGCRLQCAGDQDRARSDGDDFIINGEKTWISNGSYSDFLICTCRTGDDPRRGLTHFLLDRKEHPYEVRNIQKIAWNSQSTAQIFLTDVRVPASNMLGSEGEALKNTLSMFERSRVFVAAQGLGIARRALEEAVPIRRNASSMAS